MHLGVILVNNQLDAHFSMYLFISLLYMFPATQCSSSGEPNCINTSSGICHCVGDCLVWRSIRTLKKVRHWLLTRTVFRKFQFTNMSFWPTGQAMRLVQSVWAGKFRVRFAAQFRYFSLLRSAHIESRYQPASYSKVASCSLPSVKAARWLSSPLISI